MDNVTTFLAWWGALVATSVFVWDVYKWKKTGRPNLNISASGNMQQAHSLNSQTFIMIRVTNDGDKPTTISIPAFKYYKSKPSRWRKQTPDKEGACLDPANASAPLPHKLEVGSEWVGLINETDELMQWANDGFVYFYIHDSSTKNPRKYAQTRYILKPYQTPPNSKS